MKRHNIKVNRALKICHNHGVSTDRFWQILRTIPAEVLNTGNSSTLAHMIIDADSKTTGAPMTEVNN